VQKGYEAIKASEPGRVHPIDASRSIEEVFGDVRRAVETVL